MKKVRIIVKKGAEDKKFHIFNSPEALYVWLNDPELQTAQRLDSSLGSTIFLRSEEIMEIEWLGCEFFQENKQTLCLSHIRLAKTMKVRGLNISKLVGIHSGWIIEDIVSFKSGSDGIIKRTKLTDKSKHKFNIGEIFESRGLSDANEDAHKVTPRDIN